MVPLARNNGDFDERRECYDRIAAEALRERLRSDVLLAQGPMGSLLQSECAAADIPPAFWNVAEPQTVARFHNLYAVAGAEVLITNTFQASGPCLQRDDIHQRVGEVNRAAVDCARVRGVDFILGSIGPCGIETEIESSPDYALARSAYREQASALLAAGASGVLLETFASVAALMPALAGVFDASAGMPVLASFAVDGAGNLLGDGASIETAVALLEEWDIDAVGANCCSIEAATIALSRMAAETAMPLMVRPHGGVPLVAEDGSPVWDEHPERFANACEGWLELGAHLVGSCCGTTALTTCALAGRLGKLG